MINVNDWRNYTKYTLEEFIRMYDNRPESIDKVERAFKMANDAHYGVLRDDNKTPYIMHPVAVANFLAIMRVDIDTICAGLLHDVIEDTFITKKEIEDEFGTDVANIVEGVTKISNLEEVDTNTLNLSLDEKNPNNLRMLNRKKIIESLLTDPRIIIVKLADRLHNMLTIENKTKSKQKSKAIETLSLYVPLANKLGIYKIQQELENISLNCIDDVLFGRIDINRELLKKDNEPLINDMLNHMIGVIRDNVKEIGHFSDSEMEGKSNEELLNETLFVGPNLSRARIKHQYGIYDALLKLKPDNIPKETYLKQLLFSKDTFEKIHDLRVVKLIVKDEASCFLTLMHLHRQYKPVSKYLKDYINSPKYNMYKSLHSTVVCNGKFVQFQIRTLEQEYRDTYGLAWELYKYEGENTRERILEEFKKYPAYKKLLEIKEDKTVLDLENYQSLIDKEVLNTKEITVINKDTGENVTIRDDATIHDFAYLIGGTLGNHLFRAIHNDNVYELRFKRGKVDKEYYPFNVRLRDGDEISVTFDEKILCPRPNTNVDLNKNKKLRLKDIFKRKEVKE